MYISFIKYTYAANIALLSGRVKFRCDKSLSEYKECMDEADIAIIYYNPKNIKSKNLEKISKQDIFKAFANKDLNIFDDSKKLEKFIKSFHFKNTNLLMMSSGNFDNINIENLID